MTLAARAGTELPGRHLVSLHSSDPFAHKNVARNPGVPPAEQS
jgi:hypothetical protein